MGLDTYPQTHTHRHTNITHTCLREQENLGANSSRVTVLLCDFGQIPQFLPMKNGSNVNTYLEGLLTRFYDEVVHIKCLLRIHKSL